MISFNATARSSVCALALASMLCAAGMVRAQPAAPPPGEAQPRESESIIVTGSRIQSSFDRPQPVAILSAQRLEDRGLTNVGDALNELPAFRATNTPAATGLNPSTGLNIGGRILDLRGLGAVRTLTLVDGKRFVPSTLQATVDTNMVPSILLSRAEVVTGGASAVYGSDAVSGVVNLLFDKQFTGVRLNGSLGISDENDNFTRQAGLAAGWQLGRGLNLVIGGEWEKADGVDACIDRIWCADGLIIVGRNPLAPGQTPTIPASNILPNARTWSTAFNGITTPPASAYVGRDVPLLRPIDGITFSADGTPRRFGFGTLVNSIWMVGGESQGPAVENIFFDFPIISPSERASAMAYLTYEATPELTLELGLNLGRSEGRHRSTAYRNTAITIRNDNPFLPRSADPTLDIPTILANSGLTSFTLGKGFDDIGPVQIEVRNEVFRLVAAAEYQISSDWTADLYYQYGRNDFRSDFRNNTITARILRALDATTLNGVPVCRVNADAITTNDDPACVPLNPFGYANGATFAAAKAYVTADAFQTNLTTQNVIAGNVSGSLFELPAGPVGVALGAEYRSDDVEGDTDPLSKTGAFFNAGNGSVIAGRVEVSEFYGEVDVPLLSGTPFFEELGVSGAIRRTHYNRSSAAQPSTTVNATTWKLGAVWAPLEAVRLRVTRSRDIRAPNVTELFGPQTTTSGILTDTGNGGVQVIVPIVSGSNPGLRPEVADTFTIGLVLQPTGGFLSRLRFSADYYDIDIADAISTLGQQNIVNRCVDGDALSCSLVTRDAQNNVIRIDDRVQNVNRLIARGVDFELSYRQPIGNNSALSLSLLAAHVNDLITIDAVGPTERAGQTGLRGGTPPGMPDWTVDAIARLDVGERWSFNSRVRWVNSGFFFPTFVAPGDPGFSLTNPNSANLNDVPSRTFVDMLVTYRMPSQGGMLEIYGGIDNVFDEEPPRLPGANGSGNNVLFNPAGRMFKGGVRVSF